MAGEVAASNTVAAPAISLAGIVKSFPGVRAVRGVSLDVQPGTIHALLGENGAGKSTLIKIATGAQPADEGEIRVGGEPIARPTRRTLQARGVRVIYQERQIAADLSVAENVLLDELPRSRFGFVDWRLAARTARQRLEVLGIDIDPRVPARQLPVAQLQLVEIARAVNLDAASPLKVLVMDEPTASLSRHEVGPLFDVVRRLRDSGVGVLFISHHLDEVFGLCDEYTVLRDGSVVGRGRIADVDERQLVALLFGRDVQRRDRPAGAGPRRGPVVLSCRNVSASRLDDVSFDVHAGEIVAVTGGIGAGVSELARVAAGATAPRAGTVTVDGHLVRSRRHASRLGVALLPADRKRQGLLLDKSVADNVMLGRQAIGRTPLLTPRTVRREGAVLAAEAAVKAPDGSVPVRTLSGGNQQKVMIGHALGVAAGLLVFDEPTAGIDIASKFEIYQRLRSLANEGAAVLMCSTDFQEVGLVADRVLVVRSGRVVGELAGVDADEHRLIEMEMAR